MLDHEKQLSNDSGRSLSYNNFLRIERKMAAAKKQRFLHFFVLN